MLAFARPISKGIACARLVDFATGVPVPLQVPGTGEFLKIHPVLTSGECGVAGQEGIEPDERDLESRYIRQNAFTSAPVKRDPVDAGKYRYAPRPLLPVDLQSRRAFRIWPSENSISMSRPQISSSGSFPLPIV